MALKWNEFTMETMLEEFHPNFFHELKHFFLTARKTEKERKKSVAFGWLTPPVPTIGRAVLRQKLGTRSSMQVSHLAGRDPVT